jgi:hypothetical protein
MCNKYKRRHADKGTKKAGTADDNDGGGLAVQEL